MGLKKRRPRYPERIISKAKSLEQMPVSHEEDKEIWDIVKRRFHRFWDLHDFSLFQDLDDFDLVLIAQCYPRDRMVSADIDMVRVRL